jgi:vacuolar-type H+-ATPase subunit F/Vma7
MRALLLGNEDDARGFGLAGVDARVCRDRAALEAELARLRREQPGVGLLLVSADVAALAPVALRSFRDQDGSPPVLEVPAPTEPEGGVR